jgi:hypothetical protein
MVDPSSGDIVFDSGEVLSRKLDEGHWLRSAVGQSARPGAKFGSCQWYKVTTNMAQRSWVIAAGFDDRVLKFVSMAPAQAGKSWADWDKAAEKLVAMDLRRVVARWVNRPASYSVEMSDYYEFDWGKLSAGYAVRDGTASIALRYD